MAALWAKNTARKSGSVRARTALIVSLGSLDARRCPCASPSVHSQSTPDRTIVKAQKRNKTLPRIFSGSGPMLIGAYGGEFPCFPS